MANLGTASGLIQIDFDGSGVAAATSAVTGFDQKSSGIGQKAVIGFGLLGAAAGVAGKSVIGAFAGFEQAIANVNSLGGDAIPNLNQKLFEMSEATNQGPTQLAEGLYNVVSSGFAGDDAMTVLTASAIAATAGMTDTDTAARAVAGAINAYGDSAADATAYSDALFQTVNQGVLTFPELANNMSQTLPAANALGIGINEVGAAYASLTLQTFSASQAETGIAAIMRSVVNPTEALKAATLEYTGGLTDNTEAWLASIPEGQRYGKLLDLIKKQSGGTLTGLNDLLGTTEASTAAQALLNEEEAGYVTQLEHMNTALEKGGITQAAFEKQTNTVSASFKELKNAVQVALIQIGAELAPAVRIGTDALLSLVQVFSSLSEPVKTFIAALVGLSAVFAAIGVAMAVLGPVWAALSAGLLGTSTSLLGLLGPAALVVGALVLIYEAYQHNFLGFADGVDAAVARIVDAFHRVVAGIEQFIDYLEQVVETQNVANAAFEALPDGIKPIAAAVGTVVDAFADLVRAYQAGGLSDLLKALPAELAQAASGFAALGVALGHVAVDVVVDIGNWVLGQVANFGGFIQDVINGQGSGAGAELHDVIVNILNWSVTAASDIFQAIKDFVTGGGSGQNSPGYEGDAGGYSGGGGIDLGSIAVSIGGWAVSSLESVWDAVKNFAIGGDSGANSPGYEGDAGGFSGGNAITLGTIGAKIEDWLISEGKSLAAATTQKVLELWNAAKSVPATLAGYAIKAGGWLISEGDTLAAAVTQKVLELWNAAKSAAVTLAGWAIKAGGWLITEGDTLAAAVTQKVLELWNAAKAAAVALAGYAIKAGGWLISEGDKLADAVVKKVVELWPAISAAGQDLEGYAIRVGGWVVSATQDIYTAIKNFVTGGAVNSMGGPGERGENGSQVTLDNIRAGISSWAIGDVNIGDLFLKISDAINAAVDSGGPQLSQGFVDSANRIGADVGSKIASGIVAGVNRAFGSSSGGTNSMGGPGERGDGGESLQIHDAVNAFFTGIFSGVKAVAVEQLNKTDWIEGGEVQWGNLAKHIVGKLVDGFTDGPASAAIVEAINSVKQWWNQLTEGIAVVFSGGAMAGDGFGTPGSESPSTAGTDFGSIVTDFINSIKDKILSAIQDFDIGGIASAAGDLVGRIFGAVTSGIVGAAEQAHTAGAGAGGDIGGGYGQGLVEEYVAAVGRETSTATVVDETGQVISDMTDGLTHPPGITEAAATAGAGAGGDVGAGYYDGLDKGLHAVEPPPILGPAIPEGLFNDSTASFVDVSGSAGDAAGRSGGGAFSSKLGPSFGAAVVIPGDLAAAAFDLGVDIAGMTVPQVETAIAAADFTPISTALQTAITASMQASTGFEGDAGGFEPSGGGGNGGGAIGRGYASSLVTDISGGIGQADFTPVNTALTTKLSGLFSGAGGAEADVPGGGGAGLLEPLIAQFTAAVPLITAAMTSVASAVSVGMATITAAVSGSGGQFNGAPGVPGQGGGGEGGGILAPLIAEFTAAVPLVTTAMASVATAVSTGMATITAAISGGGGQFNGAPGVPGQGGGGGGGGILAPLIAEFTAAVPLVTTAMASVAAAVSSGMATITAAISGGGGGFNGSPGTPGQGGGGGGLLAPMIAEFTAAAPLVTTSMTTISAAVTTGMTAMATAVTTGAPRITGALTSAFVAALAAVTAQVPLFGPIGTQIVTGITTAITTAAARISSALTSAVIVALAAGRASAEAANQIGTIIVDRASTAVSGGSGRFSGAVTSMVTVAVSAGRSSAEAANQIGTIIVDRASTAVSGSARLSGAVTSAVDVAISAGVGAAANASDIGAALEAGMAVGITGSAAATAMRNAVGVAIAAGKAAADAASPSKRARDEIGIPLAEGIGLGITVATPVAQSAMRDTIDSLFTQRYGPVLSAGAAVAPVATGARGSTSSTVNHGDTNNYTVTIDGQTVNAEGGRVRELIDQLISASGVAVDVAHAGANR